MLKNANLGLSDKDAKLLYAEADMDENGEVTYQEFIPLAVDLVQSMYARMEAADAAADEEEEARDLAAEQLHGMGREEVGLCRHSRAHHSLHRCSPPAPSP